MSQDIQPATPEVSLDETAKHGRSKQGMKIYWPCNEKDNSTIDIIAVPGLGANPEASFTWNDETSKNRGFNWLEDEKGLHQDLRTARIVLFEYPSAYTGPRAVKVTIYDLGNALLDFIRGIRRKDVKRPLILIGHSMGGLVIAKALDLSYSKRKDFPYLFESCTACLFFGTPFHGVDLKTARMMASRKYGVDAPVYKALPEFLKEGSDALGELRSKLREHQTRTLQPMMDFHCYFELDKDVAKDVVYVDKSSATLDDVDSSQLSRTHANLVRFDGPSDPQYEQLVGQHILNFAKRAEKNVKARLKHSSTLYIDPEKVKAIEELLEGESMATKRKKKMTKTGAEKDVFIKEPAFQAWFRGIGVQTPYLFVKGEEGRGKTQTTLTVLHEIDKRRDEANDSNIPNILSAFYLCDPAENNSAEELLKSLLLQLIRQDDTLAVHAKKFLPSDKQEDMIRKGPNPSLHLENLWQCLLDMLADDFTLRKIYIIVNNAHHLAFSEQAQATNSRFFDLLNRDVLSTDDHRLYQHRWMFTSREYGHFKLDSESFVSSSQQSQISVSDVIQNPSVPAMIDLNDAKYWSEIKLGIQNHANDQVENLQMIKKFGLAMPYWAKSIIGNKAPDMRWVDVVCMHLKALPETATDTKVRKTLERLERDFNVLLRGLWNAVLTRSTPDPDDINEMLRALVLTYDDPSENELLVLCNLCGKRDYLRQLVTSCKPLLKVKKRHDGEFVISFANSDVKDHLRREAKEILKLNEDETMRQQMLLAWRCFSHLSDYLSQRSDDEHEQEQSKELGMDEDALFYDSEYDSSESASDWGDTDTPRLTHCCDVCDQWIEGTRFHCSECQDYDLCENCHAKGFQDNVKGHQASHAMQDVLLRQEDVSEAADNAGEASPTTGVISDPQYNTRLEKNAQEQETISVNQPGLQYAVRFWLRHGREAGEDFALQLSQLSRFTEPGSNFISEWLYLYDRMLEDKDSEFHTIGTLYMNLGLAQKERSAVLNDQGEAHEGERQAAEAEEVEVEAIGGQATESQEVEDQGAEDRVAEQQEAGDQETGDQVSEQQEAEDQKKERERAERDADVRSFLHLIRPIHVAAAFGYTHLLRALTKGRGLAGAEDQVQGFTALHFAASNGHVDAIECLLGLGLDIDAGDGTVGTALHVASMRSAAPVMKCLLSRARPADANATMLKAGPVLSTAIFAGNVEGVKLLIEKGAELHNGSDDLPQSLSLAAMSTGELFDAVMDAGQGKWTDADLGDALYYAAGSGNAVTISTLLQTQSDVPAEVEDEVMRDEETPASQPQISLVDYQRSLDTAAEEEEWTVVMMLLDHCTGVRLDYSHAFRQTIRPVLFEERFHQTGVLDKLWRLGQESFTPELINTCLYCAADYQRPLAVKFLLETCGADPESQGAEWGNALTAAANDGEQLIVDTLLEYVEVHGHDVKTAIDSPHGFALEAAARAGKLEIVKSLVERGGDVNLISGEFQEPTVGAYHAPSTPLIAACSQGELDIAKYLLEHGARYDSGAGPYQFPLIAATEEQSGPVVDLLLQQSDINVNVRGGGGGSTPLIHAARTLPVFYIEALVERGADVNAVNEDGDTALIVAARFDDLPSVEYLCDHGADFMHFNKAGENAITVSIAEDHDECTEYLNSRMLNVLRGLKSAADAGNTFAQNLIRDPTSAQSKFEAHDANNASAERELPDLDEHELEVEVSRLQTELENAVERLRRSRGQRANPIGKVATGAKKLHNLFSSMRLGGNDRNRHTSTAGAITDDHHGSESSMRHTGVDDDDDGGAAAASDEDEDDDDGDDNDVETDVSGGEQDESAQMSPDRSYLDEAGGFESEHSFDD